MKNHKAIYSLYPNVVTIDDLEGAFDIDNNLVSVNQTDIEKWVDLEPSIKVDAKAILAIYTGKVSTVIGTSLIPSDKTVPQISEGTEIWSCTITPKSTKSDMHIDHSFMADVSISNRNMTVALFRDSTCIYASCGNHGTAGRPEYIYANTIDSLKSNATVTYSLRVGAGGTCTWCINQSNGAVINFGGEINTSTWSIMEVR